MHILGLFRKWLSANIAEFDKEKVSREVIAQKAFIEGYNAAKAESEAEFEVWRKHHNQRCSCGNIF